MERCEAGGWIKRTVDNSISFNFKLICSKKKCKTCYQLGILPLITEVPSVKILWIVTHCFLTTRIGLVLFLKNNMLSWIIYNYYLTIFALEEKNVKRYNVTHPRGIWPHTNIMVVRDIGECWLGKKQRHDLHLYCELKYPVMPNKSCIYLKMEWGSDNHSWFFFCFVLMQEFYCLSKSSKTVKVCIHSFFFLPLNLLVSFQYMITF